MTSTHVSLPIELEWRGHTLTFLVEANAYPPVQARLSGPPEDCYPGEPGYIEVTEYYLDDCDTQEFYDYLDEQGTNAAAAIAETAAETAADHAADAKADR